MKYSWVNLTIKLLVKMAIQKWFKCPGEVNKTAELECGDFSVQYQVNHSIRSIHLHLTGNYSCIIICLNIHAVNTL